MLTDEATDIAETFKLKIMFRLKDIKNYTVSELYNFRAKALLSQGNGHLFSQMLENRIEKIGVELIKRGKTVN